MAGLRSARKRQSRLSFTPLPSSSPAAKDYNKQIQDRAATVTLTSSTGATRKDGSAGGNGSIMPTPSATNSPQRSKDVLNDSDDDSEPVASKRTSSRRNPPRSRQQHLDFSNARDRDSFSSPIRLPSPQRRPQSSTHTAGMFGTPSQHRVVNVSSDDESEQDLPSASKLIPPRKSNKAHSKATRSAKPVVVDSSDDNIVVHSAQPQAVEVDSEDDEDDMPTTAGTQRRKRTRARSRDSFVASSPPNMIDSDDDLEIIEKPKKRKRPAESEDDDDENEDEDSVRTPSRGKGRLRRKLSQREKNDLEEDLDFLGPSSDVEASARKARDKRSSQKDAKQRALDQLKRRRSGQANKPEQTESHEGIDEQSEREVISIDEDDDGEEESHARPLRSSQMFQEDEYDDGFIDSEEEEENILGVPDGLPLEFTRYASMKAKELFKYAVEWFVQKKINPAFQMNDPIYDLTFRKLDDEVAGLAGSKFKSSAWTSDFTMSLNARPQIAYEPIDRSEGEHWMRDTCDACNRTNHPATFQIQFQGKPYHRETLEDVAMNDDDDEDSSSESEDLDSPSYDAQGRVVSPVSRIYYVGKFCMSNAQTAHALQHWRYHLNEWVVTWLTRNGYSKAEDVVKRDSWSTKKRRKYANKIVDRLEHEGVVKQLYRDYRKNIDEARDSKQGRYSGWT